MEKVRILFVCLGNTCRSPMAKVIFEQIVKQRGLEYKFFVDSAAKGFPSGSSANLKAREAIIQLYGRDLLADHKPKSIRELNLNDFDLILTMEEDQKMGLPSGKTYTLKEYAGLEGNISDPYGKSIEDYIKCRDEIKDCLERIIEKIK
ncbi:MAG: low molecular weight protein arginine phosphatase [Nitrososphaeria archaeon]